MARAKSKANYFTKETEEYIKKYNVSTDTVYRAKIFTDHIYLPFYKLAENIIHTFKFYYTDVEQIEDLKHEIVSVLLEEKIMKLDQWYETAFHLCKQRFDITMDWLESQPLPKILLMVSVLNKFAKEQEREMRKAKRKK